jgi:hypothetical protein
VVLAHTHTKANWKQQEIYVTILICWVQWKNTSIQHTYLFLLREGFCPPCHFDGRAFVRPVNITGGLLSALSFSREGFCPPCHFHGRAFVRLVILTGGLLSGRAFVRFPCYIIMVLLVSRICNCYYHGFTCVQNM